MVLQDSVVFFCQAVLRVETGGSFDARPAFLAQAASRVAQKRRCPLDVASNRADLQRAAGRPVSAFDGVERCLRATVVLMNAA